MTWVISGAGDGLKKNLSKLTFQRKPKIEQILVELATIAPFRPSLVAAEAENVGRSSFLSGFLETKVVCSSGIFYVIEHDICYSRGQQDWKIKSGL